MASTEVILGPVDAIPPGEGRSFDAGGTLVAVFRTRRGELFATQAQCPHRGGPLADGLVGGGVLICPLHSWKFDLTTGRALLGECGLTVYPVRLDAANQIVLSLES